MAFSADPAQLQAALQDVHGWRVDDTDWIEGSDIREYIHPAPARLRLRFRQDAGPIDPAYPYTAHLQIALTTPGVSWSRQHGITPCARMRFDRLGTFRWPDLTFRMRNLRRLLWWNFVPGTQEHIQGLEKVLLGCVLHHAPDSQEVWALRYPKLVCLGSYLSSLGRAREIQDPVIERVYRGLGQQRYLLAAGSFLSSRQVLRTPSSFHARLEALAAYHRFVGRPAQGSPDDQAARCV